MLLTFYPGWIAIGLVAALVLTAARLAHIPRGALPNVPHWLWILLVLGGVPRRSPAAVRWSIWPEFRSDWAGC